MFYHTAFELDEYHKFCNRKTIFLQSKQRALKHLLKLAGNHLYRSLFLMSDVVGAYNFVEKKLNVLSMVF